jgi:hypothetical protein
MHREEDIEVIKNNIDNIAEKAIFTYKSNNEPTYEESEKVYKVILDYIKSKKRIIYGGFAQNKLITEKNQDDGFYKDVDTPDIEFYSFEPLKDLIELCDLLYSKKFKFVQGSEGLHEGTYKIFVNFENYCDISYIPKNIYDNCPYITTSDQLKLADPTFMLIDVYRVFTDPMTSYWRLEKSFKRYLRLYKYYPTEKYQKTSIIKFTSETSEDILNKIRKLIIHNSNYIVVGTYAYNYYIKKTNLDPVNINFYEIITSDIKEESLKIYKKLQKIFGKKITVKEYFPFFEYFDYRIEFLYDDKVILRVYNNNNRCVVYNDSVTKKTKFGTSQLVQLYLLSNYIYYMINRNSLESNNYLNLFLNFNKAKNYYLTKHNITVIDNSPFQEFKLNCIGKSIKLDRLDRLEMIEKKKKGLPLKFRYDPIDKPGKVPEYIFKNSSGNQVINSKFFIINI